MASLTVEQELLALENQYWQAIKDKNADAAARLSDDPCIIAGPQGVGRIDRQILRGLMKTASYILHAYQISDPQVQLLSDDVAILAYKVHEELTVDGKPVTVDAADASTWVRREGHWLCALHTESLLGDPYGRDRRQTG